MPEVLEQLAFVPVVLVILVFILKDFRVPKSRLRPTKKPRDEL